MLEIRNLSCGYKNVVIQRVTAKISPGEIVFLIGPNGSGKTTLLKTAAGILKPLTGQVLLHENTVHEQSPKSERPAFLAAHMTITEPLTAQDLLDLFGDSKNLKHSRWPTVTQFAEGFETKPLSRLSSGEQKRALIRAVLTHPSPVVFFDEPFNFLDWSHAFELVRAIQENLKKGRSFILATHQLDWALRFANSRTWVLHQNRIVLDGPTAKVLSSPQTQEVFNFRAQVTDNPLDGTQLLALSPRERNI